MIRSLLVLLAVVAALVLAAGGCSKRVYKDRGWLEAEQTWPKRIQHEVAEGESLALIADNYYGDPARQEKIATENRIGDPKRLEPGSTLVLQFDRREWEVGQRRAAAMGPYNRGVDLLTQENLEDAEQEFRLALEMAPRFVNARYNLALVLLKRGRHEEAEKMLAALVSDRPREPDFLFAYGHVLFLETRFAASIEVFQRLLAAAPAHRRGVFGLARSLQESGRRPEAIAAWQRYLELDGSSSWAEIARRNLAQLKSE